MVAGCVACGKAQSDHQALVLARGVNHTGSVGATFNELLVRCINIAMVGHLNPDLQDVSE